MDLDIQFLGQQGSREWRKSPIVDIQDKLSSPSETPSLSMGKPKQQPGHTPKANHTCFCSDIRILRAIEGDGDKARSVHFIVTPPLR
jgi:hypothetical protein